MEKTDKKTEAAGLPPTSRSLPISLIRAREAVMSPIRLMLHDTGLTEQQWRVLRVLDETGPLDATRLSQRAGILAPSVTRIILTMTQKQYLAREPDPNDGRRQVIMLLPKGRELLENNYDRACEINAAYRSKLGDQDYEKLLDLLDRLMD